MADDLHPFAPFHKLALQTALAVAAAGMGVAHPFTGQVLVDAGLSAAAVVVLVNAVNVTDVCDGFVAGMAAVLFLAWAHVSPGHATPALALSGACLGFLVFNGPPASIFLGDAGSHLLGFSLAGLLLAVPPHAAAGAWLRPVQMALVSGVFLFEVAVLVAARWRRGVPWYRGSSDHVALRLQRAGLSRRQTDLVGWGAAGGLGLAAGAVEHGAAPWAAAVLASVAVAAVAGWKVLLRGAGRGA